MSTPILQLARMCQQAADETAGAQTLSHRTADNVESLFLDDAANERFDQEERLRIALLSTPATSLTDALVLATNLSAHLTDDDGAAVTFEPKEWRPIHIAVQNLVVALAREVGTDSLTDIERTSLSLWQGRQRRRTTRQAQVEATA